MAKNGFKVFDSDMHVIEPVDLWERYIDAPFKHRAPRGLNRRALDLGVIVDGTPAIQSTAKVRDVLFEGRLPLFAEDMERGFDAVAQLRAMDREGIDIMVLYPSRGSS